MFRALPKTVKTIFPADFRLVLYGWAAGLMAGAIFLHESVELATGVGITLFLAVSVGGFLGIKLSFLIMRGFLVWIHSIGGRMHGLDSRLTQLTNSQERAELSQQPPAGGFSIVKLLVASTVIGVTITAQGAIVIFIELGVEMLGPLVYVPGLCVGLALALIGIGGQAVQLIIVDRGITQMEKELDAITLGNRAPVKVVPQHMDGAIKNTQSWVCKVTGVCEGSAEQVAA